MRVVSIDEVEINDICELNGDKIKRLMVEHKVSIIFEGERKIVGFNITKQMVQFIPYMRRVTYPLEED